MAESICRCHGRESAGQRGRTGSAGRSLIEAGESVVKETERQLNNLVLSAVHLSTRIRDFAESPSDRSMALTPLREAIELVSRTLSALEAAMEDESGPTRGSSSRSSPPEGSWLLDLPPPD
jgi:hypothetical protein